MPLAAVVLHQLADDRTLRVPHGETAAELVREAEQVELGRQLAVVALLGFLETVEVLGERGLALPCRAVDALQHRALLVAAPVRAGDLHQLEVAELARRRDVRPAAQVDELGGVAVDADRLAAADLAGVLAVGGARRARAR